MVDRKVSEPAAMSKPSHMDEAIRLAIAAAALGEVPVGAVIIGPDGRLVAGAHNETIRRKDPTAHAEMLAIRAAAEVLGSERLTNCDIYVSLEPCAMCAAAISFARIRRLYFAAADPKGGGVDHGARFYLQDTCHHSPEVYGGIGEIESSVILREFCAEKRQKEHINKGKP